MRGAVLELAFAGLGAAVAVSGYAEGNDSSMRVSEKLGYEPAGERHGSSRAAYPVRQLELELSRERWAASPRLAVEIEGLEPCLRPLRRSASIGARRRHDAPTVPSRTCDVRRSAPLGPIGS